MLAMKKKGLNVILSGGVSNLEDIKKLANINEPHFEGVIVGKALYEGTLKLAEVVGF